MRKVFTVLCALFFVWFSAQSAGATALLVQTDDLWHGDALQPYDAMTNSGITYDRISHNELTNTNLSNYDFIYLVGSDGDSSEFDSLVNMNQIADYVGNGGLVLIHYAPWQGDWTDIGPEGVNGVEEFSNTVNIVAPNDPLLNGITSTDLNDWNYTSHGYLTNLPQSSEILLTNENQRPIYARYDYGQGEVWITTMTMEWKNADHTLLYNELQLAKNYSPAQVPEPSTLLLTGAGLLCLVFGQKRKEI